MAKFYGEIGYSQTVLIRPGVSEEVITERSYYGDVLRDAINVRLSDEVLPEFSTGNSFSILADPYAYENMDAMRYLRWNGVLWLIKQVEVREHRLIVRIGGVYNGPKA